MQFEQKYRGGGHGAVQGPILKNVFCSLWAVWLEKNAKCLEKLPKNDFTRKITDFDSFTKIAKCLEKLPKVKKIAQSSHTGANLPSTLSSGQNVF